jgi:hypothetical protein
MRKEVTSALIQVTTQHLTGWTKKKKAQTPLAKAVGVPG